MLTIFPVRLGKPSNTTLRIFPGRRGRVCILQSRSSLARCAARRICIFTTSFLYKFIFPTENRCSSCLYKSTFVFENVEMVALRGAGPPVKTRGKHHYHHEQAPHQQLPLGWYPALWRRDMHVCRGQSAWKGHEINIYKTGMNIKLCWILSS